MTWVRRDPLGSSAVRVAVAAVARGKVGRASMALALLRLISWAATLLLPPVLAGCASAAAARQSSLRPAWIEHPKDNDGYTMYRVGRAAGHLTEDAAKNAAYQDALSAISKEILSEVQVSNGVSSLTSGLALQSAEIMPACIHFEREREAWSCWVQVRYPMQERQKLLDGLAQRARALQEAEERWSRGDKAGAIELVAKERRRNPQDGEVCLLLARYLEDAGMKTEALEVYAELAQRDDDSEWTRLARARVDAERAAQTGPIVQVLRTRGCASDAVTSMLSWAASRQTSRAREMGRRQSDELVRAEAAARLPVLAAWMLVSRLDCDQSASLAGQYDLDRSSELVTESLREIATVDQAVPGILVLLTCARQGIASDLACETLKRVRQRLPANVVFPDIVRETATLALAPRPDGDSRALLRWLAGEPQQMSSSP